MFVNSIVHIVGETGSIILVNDYISFEIKNHVTDVD